VEFLNKNYLCDGKLGSKSPNGGLYPPQKATDSSNEPKLLVLDIGLSAVSPTTSSGSIIECSADGKTQRILLQGQALPDGVAVDPASNRFFWTNMGVPGKRDGAVYSANLSGSDIQTIVPIGAINTPKQLTLDTEAKKVYFCDREGLRVYRCNFDGSDLEAIITAGNPEDPQHGNDGTKWCVGITVAPKLGKFYWTQKGPSKGGQGRIFCADILTPAAPSPAQRLDIQCLLSGLPEPVDLEFDEESRSLYWTDRGEIPFGNSLNRIRLDESGLPLVTSSSSKYEVLTRHLKEAIGLKLDTKNGHIYLTDLGGSIYRCDLDGKQKMKIYSDDHRAFTGIAIF
jgi:hypothetical protein